MSQQNGKMITNGLDGSLNDVQQQALVDTAITGNPDFLLDAIGEKEAELMAALARSGGPIQQAVAAIQAELKAMLEVRLTLLQSEAMGALTDVVQGRYVHEKGAAAIVSAANSLLSRGHFPMRSRQETASMHVNIDGPLPDFDDVIEQAADETEKLALADRMTALLKELDQLKGAGNDQEKQA